MRSHRPRHDAAAELGERRHELIAGEETLIERSPRARAFFESSGPLVRTRA